MMTKIIDTTANKRSSLKSNDSKMKSKKSSVKVEIVATLVDSLKSL